MVRLFYIALFLFITTQSSANMWLDTGKAYGIEPRLFYAISKVESNLRPLVVSVNFTKITPAQRQVLYTVLKYKRIPFRTFTKVIEIDNQNISQARDVIAFLDANHYKSFDIGLMQINNIHKEELRSKNISLVDLLNQETNLHVAAHILLNCYKKHRSPYKAINAYNGRLVGNNYYSKVSAEFQKLLLPHESRSKRLFYSIL